MNPLRIRASNYGPYEDVDVTLPDGCTAILGEIVNAPAGIESNGAGKSHLLQAIPLALFGPCEGMRSMAPYLTRDSGATELMVELEFEHGGEAYRVRRGYSARGAGKSTLDFEIQHVDLGPDGRETWTPLSRASTKETQAELERILGLSRDTFLASALALQGGGSFADPSVNPAARKRLLADALGLDRWDAFHDQAKADRKDRQYDLAQFAALVQSAERTVSEKPALMSHAAELRRAVASLEEAHGKAQADLEAATEKYHEARALTEKVTAARAQVKTAEAEKRRLDAVADGAAAARDEVGPLEARLRELHPLVEELPAHESEEARLRDVVAEHRRLVSEHEARVEAAAAVNEYRDGLLAREQTAIAETKDLLRKARETKHGDECDRCGQTLGREAMERAVQSFEEEAGRVGAEALRLHEEAEAVGTPVVGEPPAPVDTNALEAISARVHTGRQAQVELSSLTERVRGERTKIAAAEDPEYLQAKADSDCAKGEAELALFEAQAACPDRETLEAIQLAGMIARKEIEETQERLQADRANLTRAEVELERVAEVEQRLEQYATETADIQADLDVLTMLERAYSRDGIPALILENAAVPFIEAEASRILAELGTGFRVELRTQAALKSGGGVRDTLDVVVVTEDGLEQPYVLCSGGEETRIGLALRIALAGLLAHRRGAESRLLAIDEPSFLDSAGMQRLVEILRGLEGTFSKLILVSHVAELRDAFDQVIVVQKDGTRARVLSTDREPVAA